MMLRNLLFVAIALMMWTPAASAQERSDWPLASIRSDYNQVGIVAHVRIKSIKFAAPDIHPLYLAQSEVVEPFKGRLKRGQSFEFYLAVEEGYDINRMIGEWIIFLEGSANTPNGQWGWFELDNSSLPPSKKNLAKARRIRSMSKRAKRTRLQLDSGTSNVSS